MWRLVLVICIGVLLFAGSAQAQVERNLGSRAGSGVRRPVKREAQQPARPRSSKRTYVQIALAGKLAFGIRNEARALLPRPAPTPAVPPLKLKPPEQPAPASPPGPEQAPVQAASQEGQAGANQPAGQAAAAEQQPAAPEPAQTPPAPEQPKAQEPPAAQEPAENPPAENPPAAEAPVEQPQVQQETEQQENPEPPAKKLPLIQPGRKRTQLDGNAGAGRRSGNPEDQVQGETEPNKTGGAQTKEPPEKTEQPATGTPENKAEEPPAGSVEASGPAPPAPEVPAGPAAAPAAPEQSAEPEGSASAKEAAEKTDDSQSGSADAGDAAAESAKDDAKLNPPGPSAPDRSSSLDRTARRPLLRRTRREPPAGGKQPEAPPAAAQGPAEVPANPGSTEEGDKAGGAAPGSAGQLDETDVTGGPEKNGSAEPPPAAEDKPAAEAPSATMWGRDGAGGPATGPGELKPPGAPGEEQTPPEEPGTSLEELDGPRLTPGETPAAPALGPLPLPAASMSLARVPDGLVLSVAADTRPAGALATGAGGPPLEFSLPVMPEQLEHYDVPPGLAVISRGNPKLKQVALTFDDGPHPEYTSRILAVLSYYKVPATFFLTGLQAQKYPQWVQMIHQAGHEIGNHTYDHFRITRLPRNEQVYQIDEYQKLIVGMTGVTPRFLRPPGGHLDKETEALVASRRMLVAMWDVNINDTKAGKTSKELLKTSLKKIRPGSVLLAHDGIDSTIEMLPELITSLKAEGYTFVTMSQLASEIK